MVMLLCTSLKNFLPFLDIRCRGYCTETKNKKQLPSQIPGNEGKIAAKKKKNPAQTLKPPEGADVEDVEVGDGQLDFSYVPGV